MKTVAIIPARYASSRFPGKPLVLLLGKPMIIWVAEAASRALGREHIFVATDDIRISHVVEDADFQVIMTPSDFLTGTDRVAYAATKVPADIYLNIQGDEPLIDAQSIKAIIYMKQRYPSDVINAMTKISTQEDPFSVHLPKVVTAEDGRLLYMSRLPVPGNKQGARDSLTRYKQVCIYAFDYGQLERYLRFGRKGRVESIEDIEILRFLEFGITVRMCEVIGGSLAVDILEDVPRVEEALRSLLND